MAEPLARTDMASEGVLTDATLRLERALQTLEALLGRAGPASPEASSVPVASSAQVVELDSARRRGRELEVAAADASRALGRAMAEVQRVLQDDASQDPQTSLFDPGLLDGRLPDLPLESGSGLPDEEQAEVAAPTSKKEPTT